MLFNLATKQGHSSGSRVRYIIPFKVIRNIYFTRLPNFIATVCGPRALSIEQQLPAWRPQMGVRVDFETPDSAIVLTTQNAHSLRSSTLLRARIDSLHRCFCLNFLCGGVRRPGVWFCR